jgi:hypothetical protein
MKSHWIARRLSAAAVKDKASGITQLYNLYDAADKARTKKVGTMTADTCDWTSHRRCNVYLNLQNGFKNHKKIFMKHEQEVL